MNATLRESRRRSKSGVDSIKKIGSDCFPNSFTASLDGGRDHTELQRNSVGLKEGFGMQVSLLLSPQTEQ